MRGGEGWEAAKEAGEDRKLPGTARGDSGNQGARRQGPGAFSLKPRMSWIFMRSIAAQRTPRWPFARCKDGWPW